MSKIATLMARYYPQIDVCQSEKDGDIASKKKELELAAEEDFGNTRVRILILFLSLFGVLQFFFSPVWSVAFLGVEHP